MPKTKTKVYTNQDKINHVMKHFDFERVHSVMVFLDWKWAHGKKSEMKVPTIPEMKKCARHLLNGCSLCGLETGGFSAKHDGVNYSLRFSVDWVDSWAVGK